jgi:hypothetical protein
MRQEGERHRLPAEYIERVREEIVRLEIAANGLRA